MEAAEIDLTLASPPMIASANILTLGSANSTEFAGKIVGFGSAGIVKRGAGTLTLDGVNTYPGLTTIADGTLAPTPHAVAMDA